MKTNHTKDEKEAYAQGWNEGQIALQQMLDQYHQDLMSEVEKEREACAVTVWNYLATFEDCLEPTQRTNALIHAIHLIRKRSNQALTEAQTIIRPRG